MGRAPAGQHLHLWRQRHQQPEAGAGGGMQECRYLLVYLGTGRRQGSGRPFNFIFARPAGVSCAAHTRSLVSSYSFVTREFAPRI